MQLRGPAKRAPGIEVRGADELPAGTYWALGVCGERPGQGWLELVKQRPSSGGKAKVRATQGTVTAPSGRPAVVFGIVTVEPDRSCRFATQAERVTVGALSPVGGWRLPGTRRKSHSKPPL